MNLSQLYLVQELQTEFNIELNKQILKKTLVNNIKNV